MTTTKTLPERLRALHETRRHHFTPHGHGGQPQEPALAIVATEARWQDLLDAADELDLVARFATVQYVNIDGAGLELLTHEQVRQMVMTVKFEQRGEQEINRVLDDLCRRLGVEL